MSAGATLERKSNNEQSERYIPTGRPGEIGGSINNYNRAKQPPYQTIRGLLSNTRALENDGNGDDITGANQSWKSSSTRAI
jgi:hypothetical protein